MSKLLGYSLVELMVVLAVLTIVAAVAVPAYNNYINRCKIAAAIPYVSALIEKVKITYGVKGEFPLPLEISGISSWDAVWDDFHAASYSVPDSNVSRVIYHCRDSYGCPNSAYILIEFIDSVSGNEDISPDQLKFLLYAANGQEILLIECGQADSGGHVTDLKADLLPTRCDNTQLDALATSL